MSSVYWWLHPLPQGLPATMQLRHHGSEWYADGSGDLCVGESLDVEEQDHLPVPLGQRCQRLVQALVRDRGEHGGLGGSLDVAQGAVDVPTPVVGNGLRFAPALAVAVNDCTAEDPVQPCGKVGAGLEPAEAAVGAQDVSCTRSSPSAGSPVSRRAARYRRGRSGTASTSKRDRRSAGWQEDCTARASLRSGGAVIGVSTHPPGPLTGTSPYLLAGIGTHSYQRVNSASRPSHLPRGALGAPLSPMIWWIARADRRDLDRNAATGASVMRSLRSSSA